jgi:hypothetical protein
MHQHVPAGEPSEIRQGMNMIDAAKEAGVEFFIFRCALLDIRTMPTLKMMKLTSQPKQVIWREIFQGRQL